MGTGQELRRSQESLCGAAGKARQEQDWDWLAHPPLSDPF